jgi:glycosyltransferase involved in cell wall biosynthesis
LKSLVRIVLVEPDGYGGLAHFAYQLANALADAGADVTLLTSRHYELAHLPHRCHLSASLAMWPNVRLAPPPGWIPQSALTAGHRIRRVARAIRLVIVWADLTRRLVRERPDVVQFSEIRFPILGLFLRSLTRVGVVLTQVCHEYEPRESGPIGRAVVRYSSRWLYESFSMIFFVGNGVRETFLATFPIDTGRTQSIAIGQASFLTTGTETGDLRRHYGLGSTDPVALFFGGLRPSKGIEDLVAAFEGVVRAVPDAKLLIVGSPLAGVQPEAYLDQARRAGLQGSVIVDARYVPIDQVASVVRTADVLVLPYRSATSSAVLQVAYAFGRPVVVTAVGALAEAVEDGLTGLVVPPGSRVQLTAALVRVLSDRILAESMGRAGRQRSAHQHSWSAIASEVLTATEAALAGSPDTRRRHP